MKIDLEFTNATPIYKPAIGTITPQTIYKSKSTQVSNRIFSIISFIE